MTMGTGSGLLSPEVTRSAEQLLSDSLGERVHIDWGATVAGYLHVYRGNAYLPSQGEQLPVILKFPQKPDRWPRLCNDWAGCSFLQSLPEARDLIPRCFGGDPNLHFTLSEEIQGQTFAKLLTQAVTHGDSQSAPLTGTDCIEFGRTLGRLHALTYGRKSEYEYLRKSLGPAEQHINFDLTGRVRATQEVIFALLQSWGITIQDGLIREIDAVVQSIEEPHGYLTYTHIDLNPGNLLRTPQGNVRIIDFDSGAYRHALLDGAWCRMCFPGSWPTFILAPELLAQFETTYRQELIPAFGAAVEEDARFYQALTDACAFWTLIRLGWVAESTFEANPNPGRITYLRRQLIVMLDRLAATVAETGSRPELGQMAEEMLTFTRNEWGDTVSDFVRLIPHG